LKSNTGLKLRFVNRLPPVRRTLPSAAQPAGRVSSLGCAGKTRSDHRGCVDLHALRDTFGTRLAASGATPFVLEELMRHRTVQ
jgi:integrase